MIDCNAIFFYLTHRGQICKLQINRVGKKKKVVSDVLCERIKVLKSIRGGPISFTWPALRPLHEPTYSISRHSTLGIFSFVIDRN